MTDLTRERLLKAASQWLQEHNQGVADVVDMADFAQDQVASLQEQLKTSKYLINNGVDWVTRARELEAELASARRERDMLHKALVQSHGALTEMAVWHGGTHEDGCPLDDTCNCKHKPFNDRVNNACNVAEAALKDERARSEGKQNKFTKGEKVMNYEVSEDKQFPGTWRVEAIDFKGDGDCYVAIFSGPDSEVRARDYAAWAEGKVKE